MPYVRDPSPWEGVGEFSPGQPGFFDARSPSSRNLPREFWKPGRFVPTDLRVIVLAQDESIVSGVGGRYALALYELAKEQGLTDQVAKDLENFAAP